MPWKETSAMQQRLAFVAEWLKHECSMAELCRSFGISRQTGYEVVARYQAHGLDGLKPRSRVPHHHPNAIRQDAGPENQSPTGGGGTAGPRRDQPLDDGSRMRYRRRGSDAREVQGE